MENLSEEELQDRIGEKVDEIVDVVQARNNINEANISVSTAAKNLDEEKWSEELEALDLIHQILRVMEKDVDSRLFELRDENDRLKRQFEQVRSQKETEQDIEEAKEKLEQWVEKQSEEEN